MNRKCFLFPCNQCRLCNLRLRKELVKPAQSTLIRTLRQLLQCHLCVNKYPSSPKRAVSEYVSLKLRKTEYANLHFKDSIFDSYVDLDLEEDVVDFLRELSRGLRFVLLEFDEEVGDVGDVEEFVGIV